MKHIIYRNKATKLLASVITGFGISSMGASAQIAVDTELLLLVDVSGSVDTNEYNLMIEGYAAAFNNGNFIEDIQSGAVGSIAVGLMFWSGAEQQTLAVGWTEISDLASSQAFATLIENTVRPYNGSTALGSALDAGAASFGTETGYADNGFTSSAQIIDVSGDGEDNATPPAGDRALNVRNARDAAIASGVDVINALPIGNAGGDLVGYFEDNVIAGSAGGVAAFAQPTATFADVETSLELKLAREITQGSNVSNGITVAAVPEPSSTFLIGLSGMLFIWRRKR